MPIECRDPENVAVLFALFETDPEQQGGRQIERAAAVAQPPRDPGRVERLPIERMAELATSSSSGIESEVQDTVFSAENRAQALGLLAKAAAFFRTAEPSSPIPFLVDRARDLAQRDFLSLLNDVLPEGALKTIDKSY